MVATAPASPTERRRACQSTNRRASAPAAQWTFMSAARSRYTILASGALGHRSGAKRRQMHVQEDVASRGITSGSVWVR